MVARESCGEPWLLQPKVEDMEALEYRWGLPYEGDQPLPELLVTHCTHACSLPEFK